MITNLELASSSPVFVSLRVVDSFGELIGVIASDSPAVELGPTGTSYDSGGGTEDGTV